jgi:two-component system, LytTR family, response regulator
MTSAIIIDDEIHCIETLIEKIKFYCPSIDVIQTFSKPQLALEYLDKESPDVIFLDIEMPVINGFTLIEKIKKIESKIVFTTAYDQYAIKAIKFSAFDYLLKPISKDDLVALADRMNIVDNNANVEGQLKVLMQQISPNQGDIKITIRTSDGMIFPHVKSIIRVESSSNYSTIFFDGGKKIMVSKTLKEFDELLTPYDFLRIHNSHLINMSKIVRYHKADGGSMELDNGDQVEISRRRKDELITALEVKYPSLVR